MSSLTLEYKKSNEYKIFRQHIMEDCPGLNDYLCDMIISLHIAKPLLYRDKKIIRKDLLDIKNKFAKGSESQSKAKQDIETLDGLVTVTNII